MSPVARIIPLRIRSTSKVFSIYHKAVTDPRQRAKLSPAQLSTTLWIDVAARKDSRATYNPPSS